MSKPALFYSAETNTGNRNNNEDSICAIELKGSLYIFAVADGMGGMDAGEIASGIAIQAAINSLNENVELIVTGKKTLKAAIEYAFLAAQTHVADNIIEHPEHANMGTTMAMVLYYKGKYAVGNLGDSRVYLRRKNKIKLLTKDHSYIFEEQLKGGKELSENLIKNYGHLVTKAIDGKNVKPDVYPIRGKSFKLRKKDRLLLCSDGLITADVFNKPEKIFKALTACETFDNVSNDLIKWALNNGSNDNVSIVYVSPQLKI